MVPNELIDAIRDGDAARARKALREHPELARIRGEDGLSPLMHAVYRGDQALAEELRTMAGQLDVFEAAAIGDLDWLRRLVTGLAAANAWSSDGFTPLHLASFFGQPEAARVLIEEGADLEAAATNGVFAAGAHPLHSAVAARDPEITLLLLEAGANPNATQHDGFTPLLEAAELGDADLIELLMQHGADPRARLASGASAVDLARAAGNEAVAERLRGPVD